MPSRFIGSSRNMRKATQPIWKSNSMLRVDECPEDGQNLWAPYEKRYHVFRFDVIQKGEVLSGTSDHTTNNARAEYQSGDICRQSQIESLRFLPAVMSLITHGLCYWVSFDNHKHHLQQQKKSRGFFCCLLY